ncbi:MAG TPA: asparagine synthase-related protein, partial [Thermoanaerobaculia bacterium]|nr:asparagine synthase-related protein [Thermoanaerobaculia bacterium]
DNVLAKDRDLAGSRGLVARFPLIDDAVVELVSSLSPADHLAACLDKGLLRRQLAPFLPAGTLAKPKHRFLVPVCRWRGPAFLQAAQEALASPSSLTRDLYAPAAVANLLTGQASGDPAAARPLWALLVLEYWLRHIESVAKARDRWDR